MRFSTEGGVRRRSGAAGYSLAEVVVSLTVFIAILVGVLFIFNLNYRLARGRSDTAQRREALRGAQHDLVRLVGIAGRGSLPRDLAIGVENNVAAGSRIGGPGSPRIVAGTDVLTVRGVFSAPLLRVGPADGSLRLSRTEAPAIGAVEIRDPSPQTGVAQDLAEFAATVEGRGSGIDTLLLVSQLDDAIFAVVASDLGAAGISRAGDRVTAVTLPFDTAGAPVAFAGAGPAAALRGAAFVGVLEEYRFYLRAAFSAPGDETSVPRPQLSMARFAPGTDRPWGGADAGLSVDLADNVGDLQVALGFDVDGDGSVTADAADPGADEWLYDDSRDDDEPRWRHHATNLRLVRITIVAPAERPQPGYRAPVPERIEDQWRLESVVDLTGGSASPRVADRSSPGGQSR